MAFATVPTVAPGDAWSAAQHNTYIRDNFAALWVGLAAGDMDYYSAVNTKARLAKPSASSVLTNDNLGAVAWLSKGLLPGRLLASNLVTFNPDADYSGGNVAGATFNLTIPTGVTATILAIAAMTCYSTFSGAGRGTNAYIKIDGTAQSNYPFNGSESSPRNETLTVVGRKAAVASGTRTVLVYADDDTGSATHITQGVLMAAAFAE